MMDKIIAIRSWVIAHPTAMVADVMAEFDLTEAEFAQAVEVIRAMPAPIWPDDEAAHVAETVDELREADAREQWAAWRKRGSYEWLRKGQQEASEELSNDAPGRE